MIRIAMSLGALGLVAGCGAVVGLDHPDLAQQDAVQSESIDQSVAVDLSVAVDQSVAVDASDGSIAACGAVGQACCTGGTGCTASLSCIDSLCIDVMPSQFCDGDLTPTDTAWTVRWGDWLAGSAEPPVSACGANGRSALVRTRDNNAVALEAAAPSVGVNQRSADVSFFIPSLSGWNHIASFAAYDQPYPGHTGFGRIGAALFANALYVEYMSSADFGCDSTNNLFPVDNSGKPVGVAVALQANHWYRLFAQTKLQPNGDVEVKAIAADLASNTQLAQTSQVFPASCVPAWYHSAKNRFAVGTLSDPQAGIDTLLDDFSGATK